MDGCKRPGRMSPPPAPGPMSPSRICIPGSPASAPGARRSPGANRRRGSGCGPRWACTRVTPTAPRRGWTPSPGSAGRRRWCWRSAAGTGTSTLAMAQAEPHLDVVAVEVYRRGLAQLLSAIDREGVTNIRLIRGDGVDVLEHMFGPDSLTGVRVFFPDPWPKARHHKRRLLQPGDRRADRRPAAARAVCCTPRPTTPGTPSRSPRSATPNRGCAASPHRTRCRSRCSGPSRSTKAKPSTRAAPLPNCSGRNGHEPH